MICNDVSLYLLANFSILHDFQSLISWYRRATAPWQPPILFLANAYNRMGIIERQREEIHLPTKMLSRPSHFFLISKPFSPNYTTFRYLFRIPCTCFSTPLWIQVTRACPIWVIGCYYIRTSRSGPGTCLRPVPTSWPTWGGKPSKNDSSLSQPSKGLLRQISAKLANLSGYIWSGKITFQFSIDCCMITSYETVYDRQGDVVMNDVMNNVLERSLTIPRNWMERWSLWSSIMIWTSSTSA